MDFESVQGEEKNVVDFVKNIVNIWPFSVWFPKEVPPESKSEKDSAEESEDNESIKVPEKIIGHNLHPGVDFGLGMIHFVLKYDVNEQFLKVILLQGKNLVGKDPRGTSDPYAVISFDPAIGEKDYKTSVKKKTLNPIWNHVFVYHNFPEDNLLKHKIQITIYDWEKYGTHEPLGELYYDLKKLYKKDIPAEEDIANVHDNHDGSDVRSSHIVRWMNTGNPDYNISRENEAPRPSITLNDEDYRIVEKSVSMIFVEEDFYDEEDDENYEEVEEEEIENEETNRSKSDKVEISNVIRRIEIKKNLQALENCRSSYGDLLISLNYSIRTRRLIVMIVQARNMIDPSRRSLIPYCTLRHLLIGKDRELTKGMHRTSYRFYTANPVWNEEFQLKVAPEKLKRTAIEFKVFHSTKSVQPNDELLGTIRLGLKAYPMQKEHFKQFLLNIGKPISNWHLIRT